MPSKPKKSALNQQRPTPNASRCVIYARVSSVEQAEGGFSIDAQLSLLRQYAEAKGLEIDREYVEAETAKSAGRRRFNEMLAHVGVCKGMEIVVEKLDRLTRNWMDMAQIDALGARVHLVKQNMIYSAESRSSDKLVVGINAVISKHFLDNLKEEIRKGMIEKAKQGHWPTVAPMGYKNVKEGARKIIIPDPRTAPFITKLFEEYSRGVHSLDTLSDVAQEVGLFGKGGGKLSRNGLLRILRQPIYCGLVNWDGHTYEGKHEPLTTIATFRRVQEVLDGKSSRAGTSTKYFAYRGLMRCALCGCTITAETKKAGKYTYYRCSGMRDRKCPGMRVTAEKMITEQYAALFSNLVFTDDRMKWLKTSLKETLSEQRETAELIIAGAERDARRLRDQIEKLYVDKLMDKVPAWVYDKKREEFEQQLAEAENRMKPSSAMQ